MESREEQWAREREEHTTKIKTSKLIELESELKSWRDEVSKEMPSDFKDWWQNSKKEWPLICRLVLENRRKRIEELEKEQPC